MAETDLRPAQCRITRTGQRQGGAGGLYPLDEGFRQFNRPRPHIGHIGHVPNIQRRLQRRQLQHGRGADAHPLHPATGAIAKVKGKGGFVAQPTRQRRSRPFGMAWSHIDEGRATGAGIQVFIGAAHREIRVHPGQIHRNGPRRMRQIPHRQRPHRMGLGRDRRHVMLAARAVIHLGDHRHRHGVINRIQHLLWRHRPQGIAIAQSPHQPIGHIQVRREVPRIRQDHPPRGVHLKRRGQRLIDLDRQCIPHHHRAGFRPDQPRDPVAHAGGLFHPPGLVPPGDQHLAPFRRHRLRHARSGGLGQRPQRIAVQIDDPLGQHKSRPRGGEIGGHGSLPTVGRRMPRQCARHNPPSAQAACRIWQAKRPKSTLGGLPFPSRSGTNRATP